MTNSRQELRVGLGDRSYSILVGTDLLQELGSLGRSCLTGSRVTVVTNTTVAALYLDKAVDSLRQAGFQARSIEIPDGEQHKNLTSLSLIYDRLLADGVDRGSAIVALGGGVVGDVAGFAAATILRGVPYIQVPTTLLAQVDSSVGGKTGINHAHGKNLIGAFYQPRLVLCDIDALETLPQREFLAGLAEIIKYGIILDADLFALIEQRLDDILAHDRDLLIRLVTRSCELKAEVVGRDEKESDYRAILNFGHTLGHAVENLTAYNAYLHGEAVAIGMLAAARISCARGRCSPAVVQRIEDLLARAGMPTTIPASLPADDLCRAIERDKKAREGRIKFVCVDEIGRASFDEMPSRVIVETAR